VLIALIAAVLLPGGGWMVFAFVKVMLLLWLVAAVAGLVLATRFRRRMHRRGRSGYSGHWHRRGYWP
jgi:membrane protein implicated in regulation of membrane protease activity